MYSVTGVEVKRWGRDTETGQPLVFPLNQHLTLQLPRKSEAVITFSANQQLVKFVVPHKLKEVCTAINLPSMTAVLVAHRKVKFWPESANQIAVTTITATSAKPRPDLSESSQCLLCQTRESSADLHRYLLPAPATGKRQRAPRARSRSTGALTFPSHLSPCSRPI